ncbi:putative Lunapark family protein [Helianthus annuus]|nr:putative Lunapark family protein [Helianthus annuus]
MTTRTVDMDWRTRSLRVLPMFLLPALSFGLYYGLSSFTKFCKFQPLLRFTLLILMLIL